MKIFWTNIRLFRTTKWFKWVSIDSTK